MVASASSLNSPPRTVPCLNRGKAPPAGWLGQERIHVLWGKVGDATPHTRMRWREPLMAAVAPDHEYAKPAVPIAIRDLPQVPFVHLAKRELDALGRASSKPPLPSRSETPSEEGANGLTARRNGPTFTASARTLST